APGLSDQLLDLRDREPISRPAELADELAVPGLGALLAQRRELLCAQEHQRPLSPLPRARTMEAYGGFGQEVVPVREDAVQDPLGRLARTEHRRRVWERPDGVLDLGRLLVRHARHELDDVAPGGLDRPVGPHEDTDPHRGRDLLAPRQVVGEVVPDLARDQLDRASVWMT